LKHQFNKYTPFVLVANDKRIYQGYISAEGASFGPPADSPYLLDLNFTESKIKNTLGILNFHKTNDVDKLICDKSIYDALKEANKLKE